MKRTPLGISRLVIGILLVITAALMFLFSDFTTAGIVAVGVLGLISIAISTRK